MRRAGTLTLAVAMLAMGACKKDGEAAKGGDAPATGKAGGRPGGGGGPGGRGPIQFPVEVAPVEARDVEYVVNAVGSVEAFERVQITARVPGAVERVLFMEGQTVKKGDVLAEIEPARYAIAVRAAEASFAKARATLTEAQSGADRRTAVNQASPGLLPAEQLDTFQARARTAEADVASARAALDQAQLNQRDAYVRAPMDGVLQTRTVQTGQYVQPGIVMATLLRKDPLLLRFTVPEADAARLKPGLAARFSVRSESGSYTAKITHVAEAADEASRMVPVTAEVSGEDAHRLRPGVFASVAVPVETRAGSPVVPQTAVRASERGFMAFVVDGDKARERILELGMRTADGRVEVREGLKAGEILVVRGGEALREGVAVRVAQEKKPALTAEPRVEDGGGGEGARR